MSDTRDPLEKTMDRAAWAAWEKKVSDLRTALQALVDLKDYKDKHGKDAQYATLHPIVWRNARDVLNH